MSGGYYNYPAIRIEMMAEQMQQEGRDAAEIAVVRACGEYLKALDYRESGDVSEDTVQVMFHNLFDAMRGAAGQKWAGGHDPLRVTCPYCKNQWVSSVFTVFTCPVCGAALKCVPSLEVVKNEKEA